MEKRTLLLGAYDTATHGWTLTGWKLSDPVQKTKYIEKAGGDGSWDLSTALTDGIPRYQNRSLTATLECSEGTRADREELIREMVNELDGLEWHIVLPDHPDHYLAGRVHIAVNYNDPAHASVTVTATCAPWLYKTDETIYELGATTYELTVVLTNGGRLAMVPQLKVTGAASLTYGTETLTLETPGTYEWPALLLTPGDHVLKYSTSGRITVTYREAVLR